MGILPMNQHITGWKPVPHPLSALNLNVRESIDLRPPPRLQLPYQAPACRRQPLVPSKSLWNHLFSLFVLSVEYET